MQFLDFLRSAIRAAFSPGRAIVGGLCLHCRQPCTTDMDEHEECNATWLIR